MFKEIIKIYAVVGKKHNRRYFLILSSMLAVGLLEVISIGVILPFFQIIIDDSILQTNKYLIQLTKFLGTDKKDFMIYFGLIIVGIFAIKNLLFYFFTKLQAQSLHLIRVELSKRMFSKYIYMPYDEFLEKNIAELIHNSTGQINNFILIFFRSFLQIISELIVVASILLLLFYINLYTTIILALLATSVIIVLAYAMRGRLKHLGEKQNNTIVAMYKLINEGISALKELKILGVESFFTKKFDNFSQDYKEVSVQIDLYNQLPKLIIEQFFITLLIGSILYALIINYNAKEIIPLLILFTMALFRIMPSINRIVSSFNLLASSIISVNVLYEELQKKSTTIVHQESNIEIPFDKIIEINSLSFNYKDGNNIFNDFSFSIQKNQTIALIGKSGAGKTTLVDLLLGLIQPAAGDIIVDKKSIYTNITSWRKIISYVPQSISFLDASIKENIAFGAETINLDMLNKAIQDAQLNELIDSLPDGIETQIGDKGIKLSGGQRQRIGIARALYTQPEVIIFDEATSALDIETERAITDAIHRLSHNKTIILIAHRLNTIKECDMIYIIDEGHVVDKGNYATLLLSNEWFRSINE